MELISDRSRRVSVEELNTTQLLAHARKQAVQRTARVNHHAAVKYEPDPS